LKVREVVEHTMDRWSTQRVCLWWRRLWGPLQHHKAQRSHELSWANQTFSWRTLLAYWSCSRSSSTAPFLSPYSTTHTASASNTWLLWSTGHHHTHKTIFTPILVINNRSQERRRSTLQFPSIGYGSLLVFFFPSMEFCDL